jgi:hypothetical protein
MLGAMDLALSRRRVLSTALALLLAIESVSAVAAAAQVSVSRRDAAARSLAVPAQPVAAYPAGAGSLAVGSGALDGFGDAFSQPLGVTPDPGAAATPRPARPDAPRATAKAERSPSPAAKRSSTSQAGTTASFNGRNHVWIPALHVNRTVSWFPCDRKRPPDNHVYRWGCAGANNVYLLGHAYSVFKPLHDAYVNHRLRVGMKAWYADARGRVREYVVKWWKVTLPTPDASWAWAPQRRPSMTLQTCVGANSKYRLMVRLVAVSG